MRAYMFVAALFAATMFVACAGDDEPTTTATAAAAATTTVVPAVPAAATPPAETRELVVMTHDSFAATRELIEAFEQEHNAKVTLVEGGDANQVVNRAILSAGNPEADLLFGVDNLTIQRAVEAGVFEDYEASRRGDIRPDVLAQFGDSTAVTPIDYGFVNINFDRAAGDAPPATFEDLLKPEWSGLLVVEDPSTSSPGLQFLASTVAAFGEGGWQQFWRDLRANDVRITDGWSEAYYTHFSVYGGDRSLVVSYTTSPAAEVFFSSEVPAERVDEPPTANVIPGALFRQVEAVGVLRGADHPALAREFIDFMLSDEFQAQIPETMFVYPVISGLTLPDWWQWADVDVTVATLDVSQDEIDRWIVEWTEIMRR